MSNTYLLLILAVIAGAMMPAQAAINNRLAVVIDSPVMAAFLSFVIGTLALFIYVIVSSTPFGGLSNLKDASPITWTGGLLGAFFVTATILLVPRLGVAMTFSLVIAGQMIATLIIDHFGMLGVPVKEVSIIRFAGILLITAGVVLIRKF